MTEKQREKKEDSTPLLPAALRRITTEYVYAMGSWDATKGGVVAPVALRQGQG